MTSLSSTKALATGILPVNAHGEILLMQRDDTPGLPYAGMWNLIGGGVEPGESVRECMVREAQEEIGIAPQMYRPFGVFESSSHLVHTYHGWYDAPAESLTLGEGEALRFFSSVDALALPLVPVTLTILRAFFDSPEYLLPKPWASAAVLCNSRGEVLLMLRDDKPGLPHPNEWNFVGGQMEEGETPVQCILRETREEIGLDLTDWAPFGVFEHPMYSLHVFRAAVDSPAETLTRGEGQALRFFSPGEVSNYTLVPICAGVLRAHFAVQDSRSPA